MNDFRTQIVSPFDREYLVVEIWYRNDFIAEVNREEGFCKIQFYNEQEKLLNLPLDDFIDILSKAKKELMSHSE